MSRLIDPRAQHAGRKPKAMTFCDDAGAWRWHVIAANGQIVATSGEAFLSRRNAKRALDAYLANEPVAEQ